MISFTCKYCNKTFELLKISQCGGHTSNCKENPNRLSKYKKVSESNIRFNQKLINEKIEKYSISPNYCLYCRKALNYNKRKNKFCNSSCAAKYNVVRHNPRTSESRLKTSIGVRNSEKFKANNSNPQKMIHAWNTRRINGNGKIIEREQICTWCKIPFICKRSKSGGFRTTCSDFCYIEIKRMNCRAKTIYYNNIRMDSAWEVELAIWLDKNNINWIRPDPIYWIDLNNKQRRYYPDFYLPELNWYIDPKNQYHILIQKEKLDIVSKQINLKYGNVPHLKMFIFELVAKMNKTLEYESGDVQI